MYDLKGLLGTGGGRYGGRAGIPDSAITLPGADQAALKALAAIRSATTPAQNDSPTGKSEAPSPDLVEMKIMVKKLKDLMDAMPE